MNDNLFVSVRQMVHLSIAKIRTCTCHVHLCKTCPSLLKVSTAKKHLIHSSKIYIINIFNKKSASTCVKTADAVLQDKQGTSATGFSQFVAAREAICKSTHLYLTASAHSIILKGLAWTLEHIFLDVLYMCKNGEHDTCKM